MAFLPCSQSTFYSYKLERTELLKEALHRNRINLKLQIRRKLLESDNPIALIASYKLFANQEELERLSNNSRQTHEQTKPFTFTLNLNPDNRIRERLVAGESKQITGESDFIDAEAEDDGT
jgi:DNA helicase TIP49 (TBP-interacting protein)